MRFLRYLQCANEGIYYCDAEPWMCMCIRILGGFGHGVLANGSQGG